MFYDDVLALLRDCFALSYHITNRFSLLLQKGEQSEISFVVLYRFEDGGDFAADAIILIDL